MPATTLLGLIGNTPLVEVECFDLGCSRLFVKLESQNPGGSIKDRIGRSMIEAAERDGLLQPGGMLVEATAGNTGLGLALVASLKGYRLILVVPDKMAREKIFHLRAMGADVRITRSDVGKGHPDYYQDVAERIARETGAFYVNQFANPANPLAHETTTAPEIWAQMDEDVDAVVCGVGSGGTITGLSRFFARAAPATEIVLADPVGSVLAEYVRSGRLGEAGSWLVEGIGEDFVPPVADLSRVTCAYSIGDAESMNTARTLLRREGILAGSSSGTLVAAAVRHCQAQTIPKRVVSLICDTGNKYLSKQFDDYWMLDQGLLARPAHGDLRDLIGRRHDERAVITVDPADTLATAYARMRLYDVSQLPVMQGDALLGIIDEWDLLNAVKRQAAGFGVAVREAMTARVETVALDTPLEAVMQAFDKGHVAVVVDEGRFQGLITRMDVLNHLRNLALRDLPQ